MLNNATLWDLVTEEQIAIEEVVTAVDTYLAKPATRSHPLGRSHVLDLAAAVAAHVSAPMTMVDAEASEAARRIAVRSALLMARPARR